MDKISKIGIGDTARIIKSDDHSYAEGVVYVQTIIEPSDHFTDIDGNKLATPIGSGFAIMSKNTMAYVHYVDDPRRTINIVDIKHLHPI